MFTSLGEYVKAEEYLQKALEIKRERLKNIFRKKALQIQREIGDKNGEAASYGSLGNVFLSLGEYVKAEEYLQKAGQIQRQIGHKNGEAASYTHLGNVFTSLGEYVKAEEYLQKA